VSDPTFPPHGVARLAGFLRHHGASVRTHDLNVEFFEHALSAAELGHAESHVASSVQQLESAAQLAGEDWERYKFQARALLVAGPVIDNIEAAKQVMRARQYFDDANTYNWAHQVLISALRLLSARYYPANIGFHNWTSGAPLQIEEVRRCLRPDVPDPFRPFYAARLPGLVPTQGPVFFGISLMFLDQLVPALMLAAQLKALRPDAHISLGGAYVTHLGERAMLLLDEFDFLDSLVPGAGEVPLLALLNGEQPGGIFVRGQPAPAIAEVHRYDVGDTTGPAYEADTLPLYLAPEPVLPIRGSRGCYWGRCVFCSHHIGEGRFAPRTAASAFAEMMSLKREHGARSFYLSDDALSPRFVRTFSDLILAEEPDGVTVRWFGDARPEDLDEATIFKAAKAGLVMLFLGVESASERVRGLMQRGGKMDKVRACIDACHRAGVILKLNFIFGFPGETEQDKQQTMRFISEVRTPADMLGTCPFYMTEGSPLQLDRTQNSAVGGIGHQTRRGQLSDVAVELRPQRHDDLTLMYDFITPDGATAQSTIDDWLNRFGSDSRLHTSTWKVFDLSRTHRALLHDSHVPADFVVRPVQASTASEAPVVRAVADPGVLGDRSMVRVTRPVRARVFQYNLAARGGASRIDPTSFVCDELVRFPNLDDECTMAGVPTELGALIEGDLREGLPWPQLAQRLETVPNGAHAVDILLKLGLLESWTR